MTWVMGVDAVIVALAVAEHAPVAVTVTVYVPAASPVAVSWVCTGAVFQEYVYGVAFPPTTAIAEPPAPVHPAGVVVVVTPIILTVCVILAGGLHGPPLTVKVTLYEPGAEKVCVGVSVPAPSIVLLAPLPGSPKFH